MGQPRRKCAAAVQPRPSRLRTSQPHSKRAALCAETLWLSSLELEWPGQGDDHAAKKPRRERQLAPGPQSAEESAAWAEDVVNSLQARGKVQHLREAFVTAPLHVSSDYSGMGSAEEALRCIVFALGKQEEGQEQSQQRTPSMVLQRSGDKDKTCRDILLMHEAGPAATSCVHGDIGERCLRSIWEQSTEDVRRLQGARKIKSKINQSAITPRNVASALLERFRTQPLTQTFAHCFRHKKMRPVHPTAEHPLSIKLHVAGFNCYDWSSEGDERGWLGMSSRPAFRSCNG